MQPINYETLSTFHLSIGIGLLIGAFILYISAFWTAYDKLDNLSSCYEEKITDDQIELCKLKGQIVHDFFNLQTKMFMGLIIFGIVFFLLGYAPFVYLKLRDYFNPK